MRVIKTIRGHANLNTKESFTGLASFCKEYLIFYPRPVSCHIDLLYAPIPLFPTVEKRTKMQILSMQCVVYLHWTLKHFPAPLLYWFALQFKWCASGVRCHWVGVRGPHWADTGLHCSSSDVLTQFGAIGLGLEALTELMCRNAVV